MHLTEDQWGKGTLTPRMTTDFDLSLDNSPLLQSIHQLDFVPVKGECLGSSVPVRAPAQWRLVLEAGTGKQKAAARFINPLRGGSCLIVPCSCVTYLSESQMNSVFVTLRILEISEAQHQRIADKKGDRKREQAPPYLYIILLPKVTQKY